MRHKITSQEMFFGRLTTTPSSANTGTISNPDNDPVTLENIAMASSESDEDCLDDVPEEIITSRPATHSSQRRRDIIGAHCMIKENPYWLVEEIRDVQMDEKGKLLYLVKWVGYPESDNSWEPEENCSYARRLIAEFHQKSTNKTSNLARQMLQTSKAKAAIPKPPPGKLLKTMAPVAASPVKMKVLGKPTVGVTAARIIKSVPYQRPAVMKAKPTGKKVNVARVAGNSSTQDTDSNHSASTSSG